MLRKRQRPRSSRRSPGFRSAAPSRGAKGGAFVDFQFASTLPAPVGTVCLGSNACWNRAVEPQIRADGDGAFYVSSENGLFSGTIAAKSTDGGLHYASLPSPNQLSGEGEPGFAPVRRRTTPARRRYRDADRGPGIFGK